MSSIPKGRRSMGSIPASTSRSASSATKENRHLQAGQQHQSAAKSGLPQPTRIPKRANSMAATDARGAHIRKEALTDRENATQPVDFVAGGDLTTSRRNAPGPRKSSIRTRPPQVFASPTGMKRSPTAPKPRHSVGVAISNAMAEDEKEVAQASPSATAPKKRAAPSPRKSVAPLFGDSKTVNLAEERKRRRVTFSARQERTDFIRDEPTMRIRAGVESDLPNITASTLSTPGSTISERDALVPRFDELERQEGDDTESSSEEESSEEEEDSAMDMEMATVSGAIAPPSPDSQVMEFTEAIGRVQEDASEEEPEANQDEADGSAQMDLTSTHHSFNRSRRSDASEMMDLTGVESNDAVDETAADDESGMDFTVPLGAVKPGKLRARDSIAVRRSVGSRPSQSAPERKPRLSAHPVEEEDQSDMAMDDVSKSGMDMTAPFEGAVEDEKSVLGQDNQSAMDLTMPSGFIASANQDLLRSPMRARTSTNGSVPGLPFQLTSPTKSPGTPSRFRRSLLGGVSESPGSPARRIKVPFEASDLTRQPSTPSKSFVLQFASARKASPEKPALFQNTLPARKSMGGALPSAHSLKPGKVALPPLKPRANGADNRSSIVAAVLPQQEQVESSYEDDPEQSGASDLSDQNDGRSSVSFHSANDVAPNRSMQPKGTSNLSDDEVSQPPPRNLTLSEFFSLSGMNFHDDTRPLKVRVLPPKERRDSKELSLGHIRPKQFKAMAGSVPMLETLVEACKELTKSVSDGAAVLKEIEDRFVESPPDLVRELLGLSSEAEKKEMESQFKLQKQAARAIAKEGYLGWCLDNQYGPEVVAKLEATKAGLEEDLVKLNNDVARMQQEILPVLRERRNALRDQVERVRQRRVEIEGCPLSDLEALHGGMAELLPEVQSRRSVYREKTEALQRMRGKLEENLSKKAELEGAIEQARKVCEQIQGYTRGEAARLAAEIRHLERLHLWKIHSASMAKLHLSHDSVFDVVVFLDPAGSGMCESVELTLTPSASSRADILLQEIQETLRDDINAASQAAGGLFWSVPKLVRHISTAWTSCRRLQSELSHLALTYPVEVLSLAAQQLPGSPRHILVRSSMLLAAKRTKVQVSLRVDLEALLYGEPVHSVLHLEDSSDTSLDDSSRRNNHHIEVKTVYGSVDSPAMTALLADQLSSDECVLGNGAIAEACRLAVETFAG